MEEEIKQFEKPEKRPIIRSIRLTPNHKEFIEENNINLNLFLNDRLNNWEAYRIWKKAKEKKEKK